MCERDSSLHPRVLTLVGKSSICCTWKQRAAARPYRSVVYGRKITEENSLDKELNAIAALYGIYYRFALSVPTRFLCMRLEFLLKNSMIGTEIIIFYSINVKLVIYK